VSGVAVVIAKMHAHAPLTAVAPASRIMAGDLPIKTQLPAISVTLISSVPHMTVAMEEDFNTDRVQVTVLAKNYPQMRQILRLVRAACPATRGTVGGIAVDSIYTTGEGPDFFDDELSIVGGSRDFLVRWTA